MRSIVSRRPLFRFAEQIISRLSEEAIINAAQPDVLWVGLGCPKQEKWAYEHRKRLQVPVISAVGQAFDIHTGRTRQAPRWMLKNGLEWPSRLARNPRYLWKRYVLRSSEFLWRLALEKLQSKEA